MKKQQEKKNIEIKKEEIANLFERLERSKSIVLADYRGLSSEQMNELRGKIREAQGEFLITKNTLLKIALAKKGINVTIDELSGPTAVLFSYEDEVTPLKEIAQFNKSFKIPTYKMGFFGDSVLSIEQVDTLAKLPTKEILQGKIVGALISPIYGIVSVLGANLKNLVYTLDQIKTQKEGGESN